jgi:hypothetical protein
MKIKLWLARLIIGKNFEIIDRGQIAFSNVTQSHLSGLVTDLNAKLTAHRCYCWKLAINPVEIEEGKIK